MRRNEPSEEEITDFIDGRLDEVRRREIERWLAAQPERAAEVERQRELNDALRGLGAEILDEPVPDRLRRVLDDGMRAGRSPPPSALPSGGAFRGWRSTFGRLSSALALLLVGAAAGWLARSALEPGTTAFDTLLADASYAYRFYARDRDHAVEFPPDDLEGLARVSKTVFEREIDPPDLAPAGYEFQGARIAPTGRQTSTFFFFEDEEGDSVTVIFWPQGDQVPGKPGFRALDQVSVSFWFFDGLGFAVLGQSDEPSLRKLSDQVISFYGHEIDF